jgi:TIGR03009 family protein
MLPPGSHSAQTVLTLAFGLLLGATTIAQQPIGAQQPAGNTPADYQALQNQAAQPATVNQGGRAPEGFDNLTPEHLAYIERLLEYWEKSSAQVKRCECEFERWDYDASVVAKRNPADNRLVAHRFVRGKIRYSSPDQAQYESTEMWSYQNPDAENPYGQLTGEGDREKWICDGSSVYEFDFANRRLYETKIPPSQSGNGLLDSPLPFLFGANKDQILSRYWLRIATPQGVENEYWLVAVPKRQEDARTYSKVEIILAREDFLPKSLHIYSVNYDPATTAVSQAVVFKNRKINSQLSGFQDFLGVFVRPTTPIGWQRVESLPEAGIPSAGVPANDPNRTGALPNANRPK